MPSLASPGTGQAVAETPAPTMQSSADDVLLQQALDATRAELERPSTSEHAKAWLPAYLGSGEGMRQLYGLLAQHCSKDAFLAQLARARSNVMARRGLSEDGVFEAHDLTASGSEVLQPDGNWWRFPDADRLTTDGDDDGLELAEADQLSAPEISDDACAAAVQQEETVPRPPEPLDSYVMVEKSDVLEAIGQFVAAYLATMPEAQDLQPKQLQAALTQTFKELGKGRARKLWDWGKGLYRVSAVTYSAFSLYTNPWLVRAVLAALWTASKVMTGLVH